MPLIPLEGGSRIQSTTGAVADDFGSYLLTGKGIKLASMLLLFGNMTGLKRIGMPTILGIEQTASKKEQRQNKQKTPEHDFFPR
jgi:hypothetical protein